MDVRSQAFPLGAKVSLDELDRDPNPVYALLREREPVTWVPAARMWYLTRYDDIARVLRDGENFTVADPDSLLSVIFGRQILSIDGPDHKRYRTGFNPHFTPAMVRETMTAGIGRCAAALADGIAEAGAGAGAGRAELRGSFASRLPVQSILHFFGLSSALEDEMRDWYDSFEHALANFERDPAVEARARNNVRAFHDMFLGHVSEPPATGFGAAMRGDGAISADEASRNALTIFFGGISTVEALILNALWALCADARLMARVDADRTLIKPLLEETMRWASPVQSSARLATRDVTIGDVRIPAGDRVSCMLGAANRDPAIWAVPDRFDIDRRNLSRHLGFSMGAHFCLGSHLARLEAQIAIDTLLTALPGLRFDPERASPIRGYEFRQPRALHLVWG